MSDIHLPKRISQLQALGFVWEVFMAIALPTTLLALGGRWLDRRWNASPWMTIIGFVFAIAISGALVYRKAKQFAGTQNTVREK